MTFNYSYDVMDRLVEVTQNNEVIAEYDYDANSQLVENTRNGITTTYDYNELGQLETLTTTQLNENIMQFEYEYDKIGNIISEVRTEGAAVNNRTYDYDSANQLVEFTDNNYVESYTYDNVGNMLTKSINDVVIDYTYNVGNQLVEEIKDNQTTTYKYNENGDLTNKSTGEQYSYDIQGNLTSITGNGIDKEYAYNGNGNRLSETTNGETIFYVNDLNRRYEEVLQTYKESGEVINAYTYGVDRINSVGQNNETYLYDGRGSVVGSVSDSVVVTYAYTAYGELMPNSPMPNVFGYNGEATDFSIGIQYLRARYYDTTTSRFFQEDDYRGDFVEPQTMNRYAYVHNNPVMGIDPSGYDATINGKKYNTLAEVQYACGQAWQTYQYYKRIRDTQNRTWDEYARAQTDYDKRKSLGWIKRFKERRKTGFSLNDLKNIKNQKKTEWEDAKKVWDQNASLYWLAKKNYENLEYAAEHWNEVNIHNSEDGTDAGTTNNSNVQPPKNQKTPDISESANLACITDDWAGRTDRKIEMYSTIWAEHKSSYLIFPLYLEDYFGALDSSEIYRVRKFGANRKNSAGEVVRHHAGTDLLTTSGADVLAMAGGTIVYAKEEFVKNNEDAWQVIIESPDGTTIRYAEFLPTEEIMEQFNSHGYPIDSNNLIAVEQGDMLGNIVEVKHSDGTITTVLHVEFFAENEKDPGNLSQSHNPEYRFLANFQDPETEKKPWLYYRSKNLLESSFIVDLENIWSKP